MNLLILGATGPTGRHVAELAVRHGDAVTVLARNPAALDHLAGKVAVIVGDATSRDDVAKALVGAEGAARPCVPTACSVGPRRR
jgi:uncharacterized protein YbjT (DUF2867 family)